MPVNFWCIPRVRLRLASGFSSFAFSPPFRNDPLSGFLNSREEKPLKPRPFSQAARGSAGSAPIFTGPAHLWYSTDTDMPWSANKRRVSAMLDPILRLFERHQRRSMSTGDLATRPSCSSSASSESDLMELHFGPLPTTSSLPDHFDDCDRVPMKFKGNTPKLLSIAATSARKMMQTGSVDNVVQASVADLHRSQKWFFPDSDIRKAERILMTNGMIQGSFVIVHFNDQYVLSVWHKTGAQHLKINSATKNGEPAFRVDIDKTFRNLCDLVDYYSRHRGFVLPTKLAVGVGRGAHALRTRA